jgi:hypothetical protein
MAARAAPPRPRQSPCGSGVRRALRPVSRPRPNRTGHTAMLVWGSQSTGFFQLKSLVPLTFCLLALYSTQCSPGGRGQMSREPDRSRRLVSGRASRLATMIPPARNGLRSNGPISLSVLHPSIAPVTSNPSSETRGRLKPSRARPPGSIPSRGTATGLRSACAPKQQSQCAVCGPERSSRGRGTKP